MGFIIQAVALIINLLPFHCDIFISAFVIHHMQLHLHPQLYPQRRYVALPRISGDFPYVLWLILSGTKQMVDHFVSQVQKLPGKFV